MGGPPNEITVRVMFHCVLPAQNESRHVLIHMKPSVSEEALAMKLCEVFDTRATGCVIRKTLPKFVPGLSLITDPDKGTIFHTAFSQERFPVLTKC